MNSEFRQSRFIGNCIFYQNAYFVSTGACDFEQDFCTWVATGTGSFAWARGSNQTATANTGPTYDHTIGNAAGALRILI